MYLVICSLICCAFIPEENIKIHVRVITAPTFGATDKAQGSGEGRKEGNKEGRKDHSKEERRDVKW